MLQIHSFTFNPFAENTYLLYDETNECVIIDPGCYDAEEEYKLESYIKTKNLKPVACLQTHGHIDHVFGCNFVFEKYGLKPQIHTHESIVMFAAKEYAQMMGLNLKDLPETIISLKDGGSFKFGNATLQMILAPGHSPGSICFYHKESNTLISGDVLFEMSIGRTDLPLGDSVALINSINEKLFPLPEETIVYPGHGPSTTIGNEKANNPFLT